MYSEIELISIAEWCRERDVWLISDEMLISMPQQISSNFGVVQSMMLTSLVRVTIKDVDDGTSPVRFYFIHTPAALRGWMAQYPRWPRNATGIFPGPAFPVWRYAADKARGRGSRA